MTEKKVMLTLEEMLRADSGHALQAEIFDKLHSISERLAAAKQQPQETQAYEAIEAAQQALESAQLVMQMFDAAR